MSEPKTGVNEMLRSLMQVYAAAGIGVELASCETLDLPHLLDLHIGRCQMGNTTAAQRQLFDHRNHADHDDIVVYLVRSTIPQSTGCAAHLPGKPAVVITEIANQWSLAHEIGHVLGLNHVQGQRNLMRANRAGDELEYPMLSPTEVNCQGQSALQISCKVKTKNVCV